MLLDGNGLDQFMEERFTRSAFRLETNQHLSVGTIGEDLRRYLAGEPAPGPRAWEDHIRGEVSEGKHRYKVHVIREPLSEYMRLCCEWGYAGNVAAGEHIRFVNADEHGWFGGEDFWLIDQQHVLVMRYGDNGEFIGAQPVHDPAEVGRYRDIAERAWDTGTDFTTWWSDHPQYWRANRVPTPRRADDPTSYRAEDTAREGASSTTR